MAAAFSRQIGGDRLVVHSAGSAPGETLNPSVVAVMREKGIDISNESPKKLTEEMAKAPMSSSPWAVATHVLCTLVSDISTGISPTQREKQKRRSVSSETKLSNGSEHSLINSWLQESMKKNHVMSETRQFRALLLRAAPTGSSNRASEMLQF